MNPLRRRVLAAGGAAGIAAAVPSVFARAPLAGAQGISIHRMKVGAFEVTSLLDGFSDIPTGVLQGDADMIRGLLNAGGITGNTMRFPVNAFLVNTGEKLVMIDSGGARLLGPTAGRLPQCLAQAGVELGQIDEVYVTHMHGDHAHGVTAPDGTRMFPNAIVRASKPEIDYWGSPAEEAKVPENQRPRFVPAKRAIAAYGDRLTSFTLGDELVPGVRSVPATGHTPGHSCFLVQSGDAKLLVLGDAMHVASVQFPRPDVTVAFD